MFELLIAIAALGSGYLIGGVLEKKHYRSIQEREEATLNVPISTRKSLELQEEVRVKQAELAYGSIVVSVDQFKRFLAGLRNFFGGEVSSYASLIDRARREAFLRMKESHPSADFFINCRLETATLSNGKGKTVGTVEVLAYGTAVYLAHETRS